MEQSKTSMTMDERVRRAARVTWLSVAVNVVLMAGKFVVGVLGHSAAMVADAVHSASDFVTDFAVMVGMRLAGRPQDEDHPYGHGKYETLAAVIVGVALCGVGLMISFHAGEALWAAAVHGRYPQRPELMALWAGLVSIAAKEVLYQLTVRVARQTENDALLANAWHHRSDAFSSIATSAGAGAAALFGGKWVLLDPIAAIAVGVILLKIAWEIVRDSLDKLMEHGMSEAENAHILELIHSIPGLFEPHHLRSRRVGTVAVIEVHFRVDPEMTVRESHEIASHAEHLLEDAFGRDAIVTIHVEPLKGDFGTCSH
ncbi:MAG: cation diffusion facilitator family transporter [Candidatus Spyradenecus sp.]